MEVMGEARLVRRLSFSSRRESSNLQSPPAPRAKRINRRGGHFIGRDRAFTRTPRDDDPSRGGIVAEAAGRP
jgi:hypothetical protein